MLWSSNIEMVEKDEKVVLANRENAQWIRIPKEVYEILNAIVISGKDISQMEEAFDNSEDYRYVNNLFDNLTKARVIVEHEDFENNNKIASLQLTNRCNLRCTHCCVSAGENIGEEFDTETVKNILNKIIAWNPQNIMLSGGEPLIRSDFFEILSYLRNNYNGKIIISTNALLIDEENVRYLYRDCDGLEISIDGVDEETCSLVRGKGVFQKVCDKINILHENGIENINLSMVFSDKNEHLMEAFKRLNQELGTNPVCRIFTAIGRGEKNKALFTEKSQEDIYIPSDYIEDNYTDAFGVSMCTAGKREIFITYDGYIQPCPTYADRQFSIGNIIEIDSLQNFLNADKTEYVSKTVLSSYPYNLETCKNCDVKLFCWTCPGEVLSIKTETAFRKRCEMLKPILQKRVWESNINM